jgi:hypothetical protein
MLHRGVLAALALAAALGGREQPPAPEPPSEPLEAVFACYRQARSRTLLRRTETDDLCEGAKDESPVECYLAARARTFLSVADAISLCRCATSTAPVACYREGHESTTLDPAEVQRLCSPSLRLRLRPDCSPEP